MGLYLNTDKRFKSTAEAITQYFIWENRNGKAINYEPTVKKRTCGSPEWLETFSTIGYYLKNLKYPRVFILGRSFFHKVSDREIAKEIKYPESKIGELRNDAYGHLDSEFRRIGLV